MQSLKSRGGAIECPYLLNHGVLLLECFYDFSIVISCVAVTINYSSNNSLMPPVQKCIELSGWSLLNPGAKQLQLFRISLHFFFGCVFQSKAATKPYRDHTWCDQLHCQFLQQSALEVNRQVAIEGKVSWINKARYSHRKLLGSEGRCIKNGGTGDIECQQTVEMRMFTVENLKSRDWLLLAGCYRWTSIVDSNAEISLLSTFKKTELTVRYLPVWTSNGFLTS